MSRIPIRIRLTAWFVAVLAAVLVALGVFVVARLRTDLTAEVDRVLTSTAADIADGYRTEGGADFTAGTEEAVAAPGSRLLGAQIINAERRVVRFAGDPLMAQPVLDLSAGLGPRVTESRYLGRSRRHVRVMSVRLVVSGRTEALVVAEPLDAVDDAVQRTTVLLVVGGSIALLLAGFGAWVVAGRALRPVERMTLRAGAIDIGMLDQRVWVPPARDELNRLAQTFNAMLDRLQRGVAAREQLIADASHELRAPLAAMRAELDVSLRHDDLAPEARAVLGSLQQEAARMGRVVDNLLTLARIDDGRLELLLAPADLRELAERTVRTHTAAAAAADVALSVTGDAQPLTCDADRIEQVIANLLDNAIRASPPGRTVRLTLTRDDTHAQLAISDDGPGIPAEHRERIFERFARVDTSRGRDGGAGLGLAISREIMQAHGGTLTLTAGDVAGSTFTMALPAEPQPAGRVAAAS